MIRRGDYYFLYAVGMGFERGNDCFVHVVNNYEFSFEVSKNQMVECWVEIVNGKSSQRGCTGSIDRENIREDGYFAECICGLIDGNHVEILLVCDYK